jgi:hypothetical protein
MPAFRTSTPIDRVGPRAGAARLALATVCALTLGGARALGAQVAGVVEPPPVKAPPPPAPVATGPTVNAALRRDSLTLRQRLDIQAWVDSAAGALASGAPASTVPLTPPPPRPDSARAMPAPRRPLSSRPEGAAWAVAALRTAHYLRASGSVSGPRPADAP